MKTRRSLTILIYFCAPLPSSSSAAFILLVQQSYWTSSETNLFLDSRQLGSEEPRQSGVIIFMPLLRFVADGPRRFRLTRYGNKAAINEPLTSEYGGQVIQLLSNASFSAAYAAAQRNCL